MVFGRPPNLVLGAFAAVFNVIVLVLVSQGINVSTELIIAINFAATSIVALIANTPPTLNPGDKYHVATPNGYKDLERTVSERAEPQLTRATDNP